jgi:hypothetical protein
VEAEEKKSEGEAAKGFEATAALTTVEELREVETLQGKTVQTQAM